MVGEEGQQRFIDEIRVFQGADVSRVRDQDQTAADQLGHLPGLGGWPGFVLLAAQHQRGVGVQPWQLFQYILATEDQPTQGHDTVQQALAGKALQRLKFQIPLGVKLRICLVLVEHL